YIKGNLNKVADALSWYYQFDNWDEAPLVQHYMFTDVRLDPKHEDLPWERHLEIKNKEHLATLRERIKEWEQVAAVMVDHPEEDDVTPALDRSDNPTVYDSLASGTDLKTATQLELKTLIRVGYAQDKLFSKIMKQPGDHPSFKVEDRLVWTKNKGGVRVLCIPSAPLKDGTLHGQIINQAHCIIGHFGPTKMAEYVQ
ncbi:hypothetical protein L208DRAFT_1263123, partial [Tricholoma matsutake]